MKRKYSYTVNGQKVITREEGRVLQRKLRKAGLSKESTKIIQTVVTTKSKVVR